MPLSPAKLQRAPLLRLGAALAFVCSCLPEDDLASYSRAWTSEPEALLPAAPAPARDAGAPEDESDAAAPSATSASPGEPAPPVDDAGAPREDAGERLDAGADAALEVVDDGAPAPAEPAPGDDGGVGPDAGP